MQRLIVTSAILAILISFLFSCAVEGLGVFSERIISFGSISMRPPGRITYFLSTFSYEGPSGFRLNESWPNIEPCPYPIEKGAWHWVNCGPDWGTITLSLDPADENRICLKMSLDAPGTRPLPTNQHVKLYECQGRDASNYVEPYLTLKEAYWKMSYWFPANFSIAKNSWRLIWQYCGEEGVYGNPSHTYAPQLALIFGDTYLYLQMDGYYFQDGQDRSFTLIANSAIPKERWVSIVVFVKQGSAFRIEDGTVIVWMDDIKIFEKHDLPTATYSGTPYVIWGIGNYGGPYEAKGQFIYIKDVKVTSEYVG